MHMLNVWEQHPCRSGFVYLVSKLILTNKPHFINLLKFNNVVCGIRNIHKRKYLLSVLFVDALRMRIYVQTSLRLRSLEISSSEYYHRNIRFSLWILGMINRSQKQTNKQTNKQFNEEGIYSSFFMYRSYIYIYIYI